MAAYMTPRVACSNPKNLLFTSIRAVFAANQPSRCMKTEAQHNKTDDAGEEEFRVYEIEGLKPRQNVRAGRRIPKKIPPPRFRSMPTDQDWTDVWPTASTFNWSVVPFPVRQGFIESSIENDGIVPGKYANLELMKIPNFLHLTPAHIQKHCEVLKEFCTLWPEGLETEDKCKAHFPMEYVTSDYVSARPTQRDPRARLATISFQLSVLELDYHARDKFIRLIGDKYNPDTDEVVLQSDRCPLKSQNLDFLNFVLTAVYFESWKTESWESLKQLGDMEKYFWDINKSRQNLMSLLKTFKETESTSKSCTTLDYLPKDVTDEEAVCTIPLVQQYKESVTDLFNKGESPENIDNYKQRVKSIIGLS